MAGKWLSRTLTLSVWTLALLSVSYWGLKLVGSSGTPVNVASVTVPLPASDPAALARALGPAVAVATAPLPIAAPAIDPSTRFQLVGVVASRANTGVALISVEGKVARPFRVGSQIADAYLLKSVSTRSATLAPLAADGTGFTIQLALGTDSVATGLPGLVGIPGKPGTPGLHGLPGLPGAPAVATPVPSPQAPAQPTEALRQPRNRQSAL